MLNVLLVESDSNNNRLENSLKSDSYAYRKIQYSPSFLVHVKEASPDLIIFNLETPSDKFIADLHALDQQFPLPVIVFAQYGSNETIRRVIKAEVSAFIIDSLPCHRLNSIIEVALARFKQRQALKHALDEARTQLEDRKQIDRAKAILIKTQGFSEDEAYHTLRKLAMDRNITLGEIARNVLAMAALLK